MRNVSSHAQREQSCATWAVMRNVSRATNLESLIWLKHFHRSQTFIINFATNFDKSLQSYRSGIKSCNILYWKRNYGKYVLSSHLKSVSNQTAFNHEASAWRLGMEALKQTIWISLLMFAFSFAIDFFEHKYLDSIQQYFTYILYGTSINYLKVSG